jgi:tetratricopeptide (TPR) repeat protein
LFSIVLALAAVVTFFPLKDAGLVWDDHEIPSVATSSEQRLASAFVDAWKFDAHKIYAPVGETVRLLSKASSADNTLTPRRLHNLSIGLHAANTILVFLILALCIQNLPASFMGALLFCLHPLQVEPVAYASALQHVLGATFALFAVWQYLRFALRAESGSRKPQRTGMYLATASFLLAILTSPAFVVTPLVALIVARLLPKRESLVSSRRPKWPLAVWGVLAVPLFVWAFRAQSASAIASDVSFWTRPLLAGDALGFYLSKVFVPLFVGPDYGRSPSVVLSQWWGYATWIFPTVLVLALMYLRGRNAVWYSAAAFLAIAAVAPYLGFVYMKALHASTVSDRYMYLAMLGPSVALGYAVSMARRSWLPVLGILALVACGYLSRRETKSWLDDASLWNHAIKINPDSPIAHEILGNQYRNAGDYANAKEHYEKVLRVNATNPDIHYFIANIEAKAGNHQKAIALYEKVLELDPKFAAAYVDLGAAKLAAGDAENAKGFFRKAVELVPDDPTARRKLGMILARSGAYEDAVPHLEKALAEAPSGIPAKETAETHALLGLSLSKLGRAPEARQHLEKGLALDPDHPEAHKVLAVIEFAAGRLDEALPHYEKAVASGGGDLQTYHNLGVILIHNKLYDRAADAFQKALKLNDGFVDARLQLGITFFRLRRFAEAQQQFERALTLNPASADALYYLGDIARWQGKQSEALAAYYKALKIDPNHLEANYRIGNHFMSKGNPQQALRHYQAAMRSAPDDPKLKYSARQAEKAMSGEGGSATTM